nr:hypothetical protein [Candidatus Gracilibacteria bacterium]
MSGLSRALLEADVELEIRMMEELGNLRNVVDKLPYSVKALLEAQPKINGSIYYNGFLDTLGIVIEHETSLKTQEELKGIKALIDEIMAL